MTKTKIRGVDPLGDGQFRIRFTVTGPSGKKHDVRETVEANNALDANTIRLARRKAFRHSLSTRRSAELASARKLGDYADVWMERMRPRWKSSTAKGYADLVAIIKVDLGEVALEDIDRDLLFRWRDAQANSVSATTVNNRLRGLRAILSEAADDGLVSVPNFKRIYLPEVSTPKVLRPGEVEAFLEAVREHEEDWYAYTLALARTGCRSGELKALTFDRVNLEEGSAFIDRDYYRGEVQMGTKTGKNRTVPLTPDLVEVLTAHRLKLMRDGHDGFAGLVFPSPRAGGYLSSGITTRPYRRARKIAGIEQKVSPHWFRHSVNDAVRRVAGEVVAAALLGHSLKTMTAHYSDPALSELRDAILRAFPAADPKVASKVAEQRKRADAATSTLGENTRNQ